MKDSRRNRGKISKRRRNNAILYPIYKACSWDLLSFYSVEFLFYTITKGISASQVLILTAIYMISKILFQIPAVAIADYIGKRKTIILGNILWSIYIIILIASKNIIWIAIANLFCAFGTDMKTITEGNLLYDSVATRGGDGIYTKIDSKGASGYYIIDTVLAVMAGYLFVVNNYIPMYICLGFIVLSIILSIKFRDIYEPKHETNNFKKFLKGYSNDIKRSFRFIKQSNRMRSYIIFAAIFYGLIKVISTYRSDLLINVGATAEQFSMIYAILNLIAAITVQFTKKIQNKLKNRTLTVISLAYVISVILIGVIAIGITNNIALPILIIFYIIMKVSDSQWWVTEFTYLRNFTKQEHRNRITFTYELILAISASIISILGSLILKYIEIKFAMILVGFIFLAAIILALDYMKTRIGLKPEKYKKEDIEFPVS